MAILVEPLARRSSRRRCYRRGCEVEAGGGVFSEGLAPVCLEGKWGFIDTAGTVVIAPQFGHGLGFVGGFARVWSESLYVPDRVIDTTGRVVYQMVPTLDRATLELLDHGKAF